VDNAVEKLCLPEELIVDMVGCGQAASLPPAALICEMMAPDGHMASRTQVLEFCRRHGIHAITVQNIINRLAGSSDLDSRLVQRDNVDG